MPCLFAPLFVFAVIFTLVSLHADDGKDDGKDEGQGCPASLSPSLSLP